MRYKNRLYSSIVGTIKCDLVLKDSSNARYGNFLQSQYAFNWNSFWNWFLNQRLLIYNLCMKPNDGNNKTMKHFTSWNSILIRKTDFHWNKQAFPIEVTFQRAISAFENGKSLCDCIFIIQHVVRYIKWTCVWFIN